jgi:glycosyltransferase involved in cell wall biosynthesis
MDKKRLKIAFLCRYFGSVSRGVEAHVLELSQRLERYHQVDILSGAEADSFAKMIQGGYDLVIPTNGRMQALKASLGRVIGGYKTLVAGHAGVGRDEAWNIAVTSPDVYVALTEHEEEWIKKMAWKSKLVKIPNGIDLEKFSPDGPKIKLDLPSPIIISVGALVWYKHHQQTIEAVRELGKGSLLILGSGPDRDKLLESGKDLLKENRLMITSVDYKELPKYYRSVDLFTLPSWDREAFGIVYLEAMASGLGVVAPNDSSRREIVGQAGILVDTNDRKKFAGALEQALSQKWGNLPRQQASKFSWEKVAQEYEKILEEMFK